MEGLTLSAKEQNRLQVLNGVMSGQWCMSEAAQVLGVSERHGWRLLAAYRKGGAAALALGASGVWLGTRFVASEEADVHHFYKEMIVKASVTDTVYSTLFDIGWPDAPHRTLRNSTFDRWEEARRPPSGERPGEGEVIAQRPDGNPVVRYAVGGPRPGTTGDLEAMSLWAGQSAGLVSRIQPAAEIVKELAEEAERTLKRCAGLVQGEG